MITDQRSIIMDFTSKIFETSLAYTATIDDIKEAELSLRKQVEMDNQSMQYFAFLNPLTNSLWLCILTTCILSAFCISFYDKVSPYGHYGSYFQSDKAARLNKNKSSILLCDNTDSKILEQERETSKQKFGINNALFWSFSSLFWQSPESVPKCMSGRIMALVIAAANVIFFCCYSANLISYVTRERSADLATELRIRHLHPTFVKISVFKQVFNIF